MKSHFPCAAYGLFFAVSFGAILYVSGVSGEHAEIADWLAFVAFELLCHLTAAVRAQEAQWRLKYKKNLFADSDQRTP